MEEELGDGWAQGVHPEDLSMCLNIYAGSFDRRESFRMSYRLRRHNGDYRWVSDIGVPRFNPDGSFAGFIGSCTDITDAKLAEQSLSEVSARLIEAQEQERTWIARELHDDINQKVAVLANELDILNQAVPPSAETARDKIGQASRQLSDLTKDIQALSHRLHSSKLDYLGLVAAARSFCREYAEQQQVEITFSVAGLDHNLPRDTSLCLFRILQEALQNAVKHSGAHHFSVKLRGTEKEVKLTVQDPGSGFDITSAAAGRGLGLISMRERMQLVKGEFFIKSEAGHGTTVCARAPLP
jgi:signal transduction histidine kinase